MRHRLALLVLLSALISFLSEGASISGVEYVSLNDWARKAGYKAKWGPHNKTLQLTGGRVGVAFELDSRKAEIGGATVLLSFPIAASHGAPMISELDLRTTVEPLVSPHPKRKPVKTICLDPGHG